MCLSQESTCSGASDAQLNSSRNIRQRPDSIVKEPIHVLNKRTDTTAATAAAAAAAIKTNRQKR